MTATQHSRVSDEKKTGKLLRRGLAAVLGASLLAGCGAGPIPAFGHTHVQDWLTADFDGDRSDDYISRTNFSDVVFNNKGEIIGWYVKLYTGSPYIKENPDGSYDFSALKDQKGGISNLVAGRSALAIVWPGLDEKADVQAQPPQITNDVANNEQVAVFRYTQGGVPVTKTVTIHTRNYLVNVKTEVGGGVQEYEMQLPGLGRATNPRVRALPELGDAATVQGSGTTNVENVRYAAIQQMPPNQSALALLARPEGATRFGVAMTGGAGALMSLQLSGPASVDVYGGRNELIHLKQTGFYGMPGVFDPNWFGRISLGLVGLMEWLYGLVKNWGLVIVLISVLVRVVMWPLMQSQSRMSARMQLMQPKMQALQEKYKDASDPESRMQMQQEMMALQREYQVNPLGCFAMILPMPVLIALWSTIRNFEFDAGFLWMPDLSIPDPIWVLPVLYLVVNTLQLWVSTRKTPDMFKQQAPMYLFFVYFALVFPAGVSIYLVISTAIGVVQQLIVNRQVEAELATVGQTVESPKTVKRKKRPTKVIDAPKKD